MLEKFQAIANRYSEKMALDPRVEGIVYLGGIARNFADEYSDIDIAIFSNEAMLDLKLGEQLSPEGLVFEIYNVALNNGFEEWSSAQKEAYEESVIFSDKAGNVSDFLKRALYFSDSYRIKRALELIFEMAWHGWVYTPYKNRVAKGYYWVLSEDLWLRRNSNNNAFYVTQKSIDFFIDLMFVINRKWTPDYKWRYLKFLELPILPKEAKKHCDYLLYGSWDITSWEKKRQIFQIMIDEMMEIIVSDLPTDNWYDVIDH